MSNITNFKDAKPDDIRQALTSNNALVAMVKDHMGIEAFTEAAIQLMSQRGIKECSPSSVFGGLLKAAIFGFRVSPELGHCWLIPREINFGTRDNPKKIWVATFQIGYKGWMELAFRSGRVESFDSGMVWSNDLFEYEKGTTPFLKHRECAIPDSRGVRTHTWASATMSSGRIVFNVAPIDEVERHRKLSQSDDIWTKNYDQMAKRIPMRYLCTLQLPKSELLQKAIEADGGVHEIESSGEMKTIPVGEVEKQAVETELHQDYKDEIEAAITEEGLKNLWEAQKDKLTGKQKDEYRSLVIAQRTKITA